MAKKTDMIYGSKMDVDQAEKFGMAIADLLGLKLNRQIRIKTSFGDKTLIGLGLTIERLYYENFSGSETSDHPRNETDVG